MTDRPILFSSPMVRALLEGRKTMTRRILNPQPGELFNPRPENIPLHTRYEVGDRLWVRENWALELQETGGAPIEPRKVLYAATDAWEGPMCPSIHMFKSDSRITNVVTGVKVERLQDISEKDAIAEGLINNGDHTWPIWWAGPGFHEHTEFPIDAFRELWDSLNAKRAPWDSNPWVVAPTFTVHKCNIEKMQ